MSLNSLLKILIVKILIVCMYRLVVFFNVSELKRLTELSHMEEYDNDVNGMMSRI